VRDTGGKTRQTAISQWLSVSPVQTAVQTAVQARRYDPRGCCCPHEHTVHRDEQNDEPTLTVTKEGGQMIRLRPPTTVIMVMMITTLAAANATMDLIITGNES